MDIEYGGKYSSLSHDDFSSDAYVKETNKNFLNLGYSNGAKLRNENPFFNRDNNYYDVEKIIINNPIIASKDVVPINETKITFYDEHDNIIDKNTKLNSTKIRIKLTGRNTDELSGETPFLEYKIPFFDIQLNKSITNKFIFKNTLRTNNIDTGY